MSAGGERCAGRLLRYTGGRPATRTGGLLHPLNRPLVRLSACPPSSREIEAGSSFSRVISPFWRRLSGSAALRISTASCGQASGGTRHSPRLAGSDLLQLSPTE